MLPQVFLAPAQSTHRTANHYSQEQRARDMSTEAEVKGEPFEASANQWSDPVTQRWTYGYDAEEAVRTVAGAMGIGRKAGPRL